MSYVIHVWEAPVPATFDEATRIAFNQGQDVLGQNPGFLILAGRLKARFPCITVKPDGVWSDGPLDGITDKRVYVLSISERHADVVAHIVHCAGRLGLTVFDMQAARAWLPSGQLLTRLAPPPTTAPVEEAPCDGLRVGEVRNAIHDGMMRVLGEVGFVHDKTGEQALTLHFPGGFHEIGVPIWTHWPRDYTFTVFMTTRLDAVDNIVAAFSGIAPEFHSTHTGSFIDYEYLHGEKGKRYKIDSRAGLALAVTEINTVFINTLLPLLDRISDIEGMEAIYNGPLTEPPFQLHRVEGYNVLTLARLAGNPDYAAMCVRILDGVHFANRDLRRGLKRLIDYLDVYDAAAPAPIPPFPFGEKEALIAQFIADYDGSQLADIDPLPPDPATLDSDPHSTFRADLMVGTDQHMSAFSLRLLRDMFSAEARAGTATAFRWGMLRGLAAALLERGGVGELALFAQMLPLSCLTHSTLLGMSLDASLAESLRYVCKERSNNPLFAEQAVRYVALEKFFAHIAAAGLA